MGIEYWFALGVVFIVGAAIALLIFTRLAALEDLLRAKPLPHCEVHEGHSRICERGTYGCIVAHIFE